MRDSHSGRIRFWRRFIVGWPVVVVLSLGASILLVPGAQTKLRSGQISGLLEFAIIVVGSLTLLVAGLYQLGAPEPGIPEDEGRTGAAHPAGKSSPGATPRAA
jgi:hypothetical protein